jgi:predicted HAD superfamily Cof-like phosphohydrolase
LKHGLQEKITEVFLEIQRSNMSKLGADGNPFYRADGKVLKGERYFKPDIAAILSH